VIVRGSYEDIIYVVIGILWIAYSIYKGTQKSKAKNQKKENTRITTEERKKSVFETFFDDILTEEKPTPIIPYEENVEFAEEEEKEEIKEQVSNTTENENVFSYDDYYEEGNFQESEIVNEKESDVKSIKEKDLLKDIKLQRKKSRIDLRKAVIYSEILNRRYF
jgi:hypothetical protein